MPIAVALGSTRVGSDRDVDVPRGVPQRLYFDLVHPQGSVEPVARRQLELNKHWSIALELGGVRDRFRATGAAMFRC